ncbi:MAG: isoprenylcysteine carboxylmethyltransferase family protein [Candidatus Wallbacteria bacterium]|nr:isoprenylcysteine carboxylmethyltransferase family protein [Candidatus Wallbacteria bacterium]
MLGNEFVREGNWLFRWRSFFPLILILLVVASMQSFSYPAGEHRFDICWKIFCICISFVGIAVRMITGGYAPQGTSGRNTKGQLAETLNTKGLYSIMRNPLYLGNYFVGLGVFLYLRNWWAPLIYTLSFILFYERIIFAEEHFLADKFGTEYQSWVEKTPAFFPRHLCFEKPELPFSWKTALRREYQTIYGLLMIFCLLEFCTDFYIYRHFQIDMTWLLIITISTVCYAATWILHKKVRFFDVEGR